MNSISKDTALKFCELCNWVYEVWVTHKKLFDENHEPDKNIGKVKYFTHRLSIITQEYCLLQISKLHDPAIQRGSLNLTIDYIVRFGSWGDDEDEINSISKSLAELWAKIKPARHKILAHNDLETFFNEEDLGEFPDELDRQYFELLQRLVNIVHEKWIGGPFPFNDLAESDVDEFLFTLNRA